MPHLPFALRRFTLNLRIAVESRLDRERSRAHPHYGRFTLADWRLYWLNEPQDVSPVACTLPGLIRHRCRRMLGIPRRAATVAPRRVPAGLEGLAAALERLSFPQLHRLSLVGWPTPPELRGVTRYIFDAATWERDGRMALHYPLPAPMDVIRPEQAGPTLMALAAWAAAFAGDDRAASIGVLDSIRDLIAAGGAPAR